MICDECRKYGKSDCPRKRIDEDLNPQTTSCGRFEPDNGRIRLIKVACAATGSSYYNLPR